MDEFFMGLTCGVLVSIIIIVAVLSIKDNSAIAQCNKLSEQECVYVPSMYKPKEMK